MSYTIRKTGGEYVSYPSTSIEHKITMAGFPRKPTAGTESNFFATNGLSLIETNWCAFGTNAWNQDLTNALVMGGTVSDAPVVVPCVPNTNASAMAGFYLDAEDPPGWNDIISLTDFHFLYATNKYW